MLDQMKWLWSNMDEKLRPKQVLALLISVFTSALLIVNPALTQKLIDDVILAQNPDPLLGILAGTLFL